MRSDQGSIFAGTIMEENGQTRLRHILERPSAPDGADAENFAKLKNAYNACLDESTIKERGIKPLVNLLEKFQSVYPASDATGLGAEDHLTEAVLFLIKSGVEALVAPDVSVGPLSSILYSFFTDNHSLMIATLTMLLFLSTPLMKSVSLQENTTTTQKQLPNTRRWLSRFCKVLTLQTSRRLLRMWSHLKRSWRMCHQTRKHQRMLLNTITRSA